jgi:archaellum component FlaC
MIPNQGSLNAGATFSNQPEESEFVQECRNLEHRIADLNELVEVLKNRLTPVKVSQPPPNEKPQPIVEALKAPVNEFLRQQSSRIQTINDSLNQLLSELRI